MEQRRADRRDSGRQRRQRLHRCRQARRQGIQKYRERLGRESRLNRRFYGGHETPEKDDTQAFCTVDQRAPPLRDKRKREARALARGRGGGSHDRQELDPISISRLAMRPFRVPVALGRSFRRGRAERATERRLSSKSRDAGARTLLVGKPCLVRVAEPGRSGSWSIQSLSGVLWREAPGRWGAGVFPTPVRTCGLERHRCHGRRDSSGSALFVPGGGDDRRRRLPPRRRLRTPWLTRWMRNGWPQKRRPDSCKSPASSLCPARSGLFAPWSQLASPTRFGTAPYRILSALDRSS